ncbi:tyrosine-protein phosphatase [Acetobacterium bakii]|uniref:Protein tyrosine phosphatase n=1 Tax=Acetobacterium bakii TaxID=52689 RepID=A0A0L6U2L0_9FIRM|nr:tyrosine-protein phosphatase [Acetobacterium bakii]KNZ42025.1 protein tyrosine phosphatase [Acetobacterium bakii]
MKKKLGIALIIGVAAGIPAFILGRKRRYRKNFEEAYAKGIAETTIKNPTGPISPTGTPLYNFKDEENLIFCDETQLAKRLIQLENSINIRDIGGYTGHEGRKVKWRKVIRSEELAHLSDKDVAYFEDLDLKHAFDFRNKRKADQQVDRLPESTEYHLIPIFDSFNQGISEMDFTQPGSVDTFMRAIYKIQTEDRAQCFAEVLKVLTEPSEFPILYHCTNGKDRTGFMTYLILSLLGVAEETIISDYTLTNLTFDESYLLLGNIMSEELGVENHHLWEFYGVKPAWLQISILYIKENFGTVEEYLLSETDLTTEDFEKIRENLLEK